MQAAPNEFPDRISPILVKELRQGLRTWIFVGSFVVLQVAMLFLSIMGLSSAASRQSTDEYALIFWVIIGVPLLIIVPLTGLGSIGAERKANTLELVFLTRLTARRILFGKFAAQVLQGALLVCACVPYAVFRYFLGGVNLVLELQVLVALLFTSMILSGVAIGVSPLPTGLTRIASGLLIFLSLYAIPGVLFGSGMMRALGPLGFSLGFSPVASGFWLLTILLITGTLLLLLAWEFGSAQIAPPAENHSTPARLLALFTIALALIIRVWEPRLAEAAVVFALAFAFVITVGVLCEQPRFIPALYRPFVRRGALGRIVGHVLYPGWPSAVLFSVLLYGIAVWLTRLEFETVTMPEAGLFWGVGFGMVLVPLAITRMIWPIGGRPFIVLIAFQAGCAVIYAIASLLKDLRIVDLEGVLDLLPTLAFFTVPSSHLNPYYWSELVPAFLVTLLSLVVLLWRMLAAQKQIRACEQAAAQATLPSSVAA